MSGSTWAARTCIDAQDPAAGTAYSSLAQWDGHIVGFGNEPNATGILGQVVGAIAGFASEAWQGLEGLTNAVGDALSGNMTPLIGYIKGGASELLKLAKLGSEAVFNAVWSDAIQPIISNVIPGGNTSAVGAVLDYAGASIKKGIDALLGQKDAAAQAQATALPDVGAGTPGHGLVPANAAAIAAFLESRGLTKIATAGILGNIEQESGGNPMAGTNPPGRGLIRFLGDPGGSLASELAKTMQYIAANGSVADINANSSTPTAAAVYFSEKYERPGNPQIQNRIASAVASYAAGYAAGGPVGYATPSAPVKVPDVTGQQAGAAYNMLKAADLVPTWTGTNKATWYVTSQSPAPDSAAAPGMAVSFVSSASAPAAAHRPCSRPDRVHRRDRVQHPEGGRPGACLDRDEQGLVG